MTEHYIDERKQYVAEVKKSFETQYGGRLCGSSQAGWEEKADIPSFSSLKFKFIVAIFLFCLYLYCDYTGTAIGQYSARDIAETISENEFYQKMENYVMMELSQE